MTGTDQISSTEKLLGIIRKKGQLPKPAKDIRLTANRPESPLYSHRKKVFPFSKSVTVGVVVGHKDLTLAMMSSMGERKYQLLDFQKIPLGPEVGKGHPQFPFFLKNALKQFCGDYDKINIWSTIPSARVEIRFLKIPKVPESQIANAVYWSYKKLVPFDDKEMIFDFELLGEAIENGSRRIQTVAYSAPRVEVDSWKKLFSEIGFTLAGLSIVPFALRNLFRANIIDHHKDHVCSLYIGQDWSRIDIFSEGNLVLSRDIKTGMNSFIESIRSGINTKRQYEKFGVEPAAMAPLEDMGQIREGRQSDLALEAADRDEARHLFFRLIRQTESNERTAPSDPPSEAETLDMISPVLDRLIRQVERTLGHFTLHFNNKQVGKIYLGGEISGRNPIVEMMGDQLSYPISHLNPFSTSIVPLDHPRFPQTISERDSFVPAIGSALSTLAVTPNLIYTYRSKAIQAKIQRMNRVVFSAFILLTLVCLGVYYRQGWIANQKKQQVSLLEKQYAGQSPIINQSLLQQMVAKVETDQKKIIVNAQRYLGASLLNELAELTPGNIRLFTVKLDLGRGIDKGKVPQRALLMEGLVTDTPLEQESSLAQYLFKLNNSPLFKTSTVIQKTVEIHQEKEVLRFKAKVETI